MRIEKVTTECIQCGVTIPGEVRFTGDGRQHEWWNLGTYRLPDPPRVIYRSANQRPSLCIACEHEVDEVWEFREAKPASAESDRFF